MFALGALAVMLTSAINASATESTRLMYARGPGAEQCPDDRALRSAVAARLGYDPFVAWAKTTINAHIARENGKLRARVFLADEDGRVRGSRELAAALDDCDRLIAAMSLAISIAIDPMSTHAVSAPLTDGQRDAALPPDEPARTERATTAVPLVAVTREGEHPSDVSLARQPARSHSPFAWLVGLGPLIATGTAPSLATGAALFARISKPAASVAVEFRYDLPVSANAPRGDGTVHSHLVVLSLESCARFGVAAFCGLTSVGSRRAWGSGVVVPLEQSALYFATGARVSLELPISDALSLRAYGDTVANLTGARLVLDGENVWRAPVIAGVVGLNATARVW